ncbi:hypothetical protein VTI74DRAFT_11184 [Chaetomium olivicolor]
MSVFSMIKRGRQAAKEHRAERAEKEKKEAEKPPYKHIPKHAAIDALSGGPAGWRENDRVRILEQNRRRSAMTASGVGMSGVVTPVNMGIPRVQSALSHVSYPSAYASPIVQLPRNYSYSSMPPGWTPTGREMSYSPIDFGGMSLKGKEVERIIDSSRTSRSSSKVSTGRIPLPSGYHVNTGDAAPSPVESSSNSTSSQDELEMKPVTRHKVSTPPAASPATQSRETEPMSRGAESIHRLHPGRSRRVSDPSRSPLASRHSSLAPGIPPVPAIPPMQFGTAITTPEVFSSASSSASSVTMVPVGSSTSLSAKIAPSVATPTVLRAKEAEAPLQAEIVPAESSEEVEDEVEEVGRAKAAPPSVTPTVIADSPTKKGRRISKMTRFTELETIESESAIVIEPVTPILKQTTLEKDEKRRPTSTATVLPTSFDESALPAPRELAIPTSPPSASKSGRLSKTPAASGKLVKKNRWSLRSSKSSVAAC